jgi:hypothetical protein
VGAGFKPEGGHLVLLVADAQGEVMQGTAKNGVGAVIERLERQHLAMRMMFGSTLAMWMMFGSTLCLRKLLKKNFRR